MIPRHGRADDRLVKRRQKQGEHEPAHGQHDVASRQRLGVRLVGGVRTGVPWLRVGGLRLGFFRHATRSIPGQASNPRSKLRMRLIPAVRMVATCRASRAERPPTELMSALAARISDMPKVKMSSAIGIQGLKGRVDGVQALRRRIAMQDLLVDLDVGDESLPVSDEPCEDRHRPILVRMRRSHQVHRHIGINEDHGCRYPASISWSMSSISAVGKLCHDASAIARSLASIVPASSLRAWRSAWRTHSATVTRCRRATP